MSYALVVNNVIQSEGGLPASAVRLDTGQWVMPNGGLANGTVAEQQACGYFLVTDTARPADTATKTYDRSLVLVAGVPTVTWTQRNQTADELATTASISNRATITTQAGNALAANQTYLGIVGPTNAQVVAQVRALTQQMDGAIRLLIGRLDATN